MCAVLIVDQLQDFRQTVRAILQSKGYETVGAVDPDHALMKVQGLHISVVVVGASLTDTTGLALVRRVRLIAPSLPVIVVTDHPSPEAGGAYQGLGACAYLPRDEFLKGAPDAVGKAVDTFREAG